MPPTRRTRTSSGPALRGAQKTLTFSNTKSTKPPGKPSPSPLSKPAPSEPGHISSEAAITSQSEVERGRVKQEGYSAEEEKASRVKDADVKTYWRAREAERRAARVHQEGVSLEEKVLRLFDMSSQFGPAIGIARRKRWVRANKLGLNPPIEVLAVLLKEEERGHAKSERAYVDELMSGKALIGDA